MNITTEHARFIVRVMDTLQQHPDQVDDDLIEARRVLGELYQKHGRWSEGSIGGRAEWLVDHLAKLTEAAK